MKNKINRIASLVGKTPLIRLYEVEKHYVTSGRLFAKLERLNPSGSVKDRAALFIVDDAFRRGLISEVVTVIEPTSGNMGISLAMLSSLYGYNTVITMPENMSAERAALISALGGRIITTPADRGMQGAIELALDLAKDRPAFMPSQFTNPMSTFAHYMTTGREIYEDTSGEVDILVAGVGTAGTLIGTGRYLKERGKEIRVVAVEPRESAVISGGCPAAHGIQGIGAGFLPPLYESSLVDEVISVGTDEAVEMMRTLARREGVLSGISSGAALSAAVELAKRDENRDKNIVVILPDSGERYMSII